MESKTYETYIEKLILDNFDWSTFSPDNDGKIFDKFKTVFYKDHVYWIKRSEKNGTFCIEFKKYGENRQRIFLKFSFLSNHTKPRELRMELLNEELKLIDKMQEDIPLTDIWKDHSVLSKILKQYINLGLDLAAKTH